MPINSHMQALKPLTLQPRARCIRTLSCHRGSQRIHALACASPKAAMRFCSFYTVFCLGCLFGFHECFLERLRKRFLSLKVSSGCSQGATVWPSDAETSARQTTNECISKLLHLFQFLYVNVYTVCSFVRVPSNVPFSVSRSCETYKLSRRDEVSWYIAATRKTHTHSEPVSKPPTLHTTYTAGSTMLTSAHKPSHPHGPSSGPPTPAPRMNRATLRNTKTWRRDVMIFCRLHITPGEDVAVYIRSRSAYVWTYWLLCSVKKHVVENALQLQIPSSRSLTCTYT